MFAVNPILLDANFKEWKGSSDVFHQQNIVMFHHPDRQIMVPSASFLQNINIE
jgi:hypothetical protein